MLSRFHSDSGVAKLRGAIRRLGMARGLSQNHAKDLSGVLVETSWYGIDAHGVRTDPVSADTDCDGVKDGQEVSNGTDPLRGPGGSTCHL
jgi:LDH2 family malate/lactate/ureidoglycolate dehydrogenase